MIIKDKKLVVTGGSGFVGSQIINHFKNDNSILAIDQTIPTISEGRTVFLEHKIENELPKNENFHKPIVIHTAAVMNSKDFDEIWNSNVIGTKNILKWSLEHGCSHFIFFSTGGVYGYRNNTYVVEDDIINPIGNYGFSKLIGENLCHMFSKQYQMNITIIRLYFPYGKNQKNGIFPFIYNSAKKSQKLFINNFGKPIFRPIHISDIISAIELIILYPKEFSIYNLCGDDELSFLDAVNIISKIYNLEISYEYNGSECGDLLASNQKIKEELGWRPQVKFAEMIGSIF